MPEIHIDFTLEEVQAMYWLIMDIDRCEPRSAQYRSVRDQLIQFRPTLQQWLYDLNYNQWSHCFFHMPHDVARAMSDWIHLYLTSKVVGVRVSPSGVARPAAYLEETEFREPLECLVREKLDAIERYQP